MWRGLQRSHVFPVDFAAGFLGFAGRRSHFVPNRYFSLSIRGGEPSVAAALGWNLIPAGIGNVIGGTFVVALPFWFLYERDAGR